MHAKTAQFERSCLDLAAIYEICRILGASSDARRSFRAALNVLSAHLDLHRLMVVAVDDDGQLFTLSFVGLTSEHAERGHWKPGEGIIGTVFTTGMALVVPGVRDSPEFLDRTGAFGAKADERHAFIVVPLKTDKHVLRVLAAQRRIEGLARRSDDQRVLPNAATLIAQNMQLQRAVKEEHRCLQEETARMQKPRPRARSRASPTWSATTRACRWSNDYLGHGAMRLGAGQGRAAAEGHAAADGPRPAAASDRGAQALRSPPWAIACRRHQPAVFSCVCRRRQGSSARPAPISAQVPCGDIGINGFNQHAGSSAFGVGR